MELPIVTSVADPIGACRVVHQSVMRLAAAHRADRRDDARKAYSRAVELDPANAHARAMLEKLK